MVSSRGPSSIPDLSVRTTSPTHTSNSSSPNTSEPEFHYTTRSGLDPVIVASMNQDQHNSKFELPAFDKVATDPKKESETPEINVINTDLTVTLDTPTDELPNPYDIAPDSHEATDLHDVRRTLATPSLVESDGSVLQRLPSALRPAHPRFVDSTDSRRASMSLGGLEFGLPSERGSPLVLERGRALIPDGRRSFPLSESSFPTKDERPFSTVDRKSFTSEIGVPFVSTNGGLTVGSPMFESERMRRHSAAATSSATAPIMRHSHHSALSVSVSYGMEPKEEPQSKADLKPSQGFKGPQSTNLWPDVPRSTMHKRSSRWKFWSKTSTKA